MLITLTIMKCSVCDQIFTQRSGWLLHLLQKGHQRLARKALLSWGEEEKACTLVLFGKHPVGEDDRIIQYLSKNKDIFVTDFVWWPGSRVAFVQFKDRDAVTWIVRSLDRRQFRIDPGDQFCQVKEGWTIPELEWTVLLPDGVMMSPPQPGDAQQPAGQHPELEPSEVKLESNVSRPEVDIAPVPPLAGIASSSSTSSLRELGDGGDANKLGLRDHLLSIRNRIEIPDEEYKLALDILSGIQERISSEAGNHPSPQHQSIKAAISRHWNLMLRYRNQNGKNSPLSIILYTGNDAWDLKSKTAIISMAQLKDIDSKMLRTGNAQRRKCFLSFEVLFAGPDHVDPQARWGAMRYEIKPPSGGRPFEFSIHTNPFFIVEIQVWRLIKHLCRFDPRCSPVLAVLYYWARVNSVLVGSTTGSSSNLPDPSGLNWLLMLFFQQEGVIPSVKRVLSQPHQTQLYNGTDIGFSDDSNSELLSAWMSGRRSGTGMEDLDQEPDENFAMEVFTLLQKFFSFCSTKLEEGAGWLLNTRDGEILPLQEFMCVGNWTPKNSRMTSYEQACTIRMINDEKLWEQQQQGDPASKILIIRGSQPTMLVKPSLP